MGHRYCKGGVKSESTESQCRKHEESKGQRFQQGVRSVGLARE